MTEQNRKTLRSFYCRDYLWELFEVMARDLGCSMDYLVNEAMRHYARSRNYSLASGRSQPLPAPEFGGGNTGVQAAPSPYGNPGQLAGQAPPVPGYPGGPPAFSGRAPTAPPLQPSYDTRLPTQSRGPGGFGGPPAVGDYFPPPPYAPPAPAGYDLRTSTPQAGAPAPTGGYAPAPVPLAGPGGLAGVASPSPGAGAGAQPPLFLIFQGQKYRIEKEKFIIGRGSQMTDLTIRDGNISRKHAAVIFRSGKYFIKDLDSTNGIDFQGSRIDSKKVEEGDVFHLCDYELRFTYR